MACSPPRPLGSAKGAKAGSRGASDRTHNWSRCGRPRRRGHGCEKLAPDDRLIRADGAAPAVTDHAPVDSNHGEPCCGHTRLTAGDRYGPMQVP
jgi:hypothetical protein